MSGALVRAVWRRLPVGFRRGLAHGLLSRLAPRLGPAPDVPVDAPRVVVGFLSSPSGFGQSARLALKGFAARGLDVYGIDLSRNFFETAERVRFEFRDGRALRGPAHVLININAPYMRYVLQLLGRNFLRDKFITAYWAWELPRAPEAWRAGLACAHAFAAPSRFAADAIAVLPGAPAVQVAAHPVALEPLPPLAPRAAGGPFTIVSALSVASGFARKNPLALIAAFKAAFGNGRDARLRLLVSGAEHYPPAAAALRAAVNEAANIELTFDAYDRDQYWAWYGAPDLYASLHRAEGFGLPLAESMRRGAPVLATAWSANAEYLDETNSLPVRYQLVPVADPQQKYAADGQSWAEADLGHAAELMLRAAKAPAWRAALAEKARADALLRFSAFAL
jgi:glycosyltransferase involved in cell wall biosynthesis